MLQPYQNLVSSGVSSPYRSKSSYRHSCAPSYIPFTFDSCTVSHSLSLLPAAIGVRLGQGHLTGSLPVPILPALHSASAPLISHSLEIQRGLSPWNPPGPWVLRRDVLWWHRNLFSSQGSYFSCLGGPVPPISLAGGWPPSPWFLLLSPGRGTAWMSPWVPSWLVQRHSWCRGWTSAWMPTPVGVTSTVWRKMTAGDYGPPPITSSPTMTTPEPSHTTMWSLHTGHQWIRQGSGFWWTPSFPCPGKFLGSVHVPRSYYQDSLGQFQKVSPQFLSDLWILEMCDYVSKTAPCPHVVSIPWVSDARFCILCFSDEK